MTETLIIISIFAAGLGAVIWIAKAWGESEIEKELERKKAERLKAYEDINAEPDDPDPYNPAHWL